MTAYFKSRDDTVWSGWMEIHASLDEHGCPDLAFERGLVGQALPAPEPFNFAIAAGFNQAQ